MTETAQRRNRKCPTRSTLSKAGTVVVVVVATALVIPFFSRKSDDNPMSYVAKPTTLAPTLLDQYVASLLLPNSTMLDIDSPQSTAYQWLLQDPYLADYAPWRVQQRYALATLFHSTGGPTQWVNNTNWLSHEHHECAWYSATEVNSPMLQDAGICDEGVYTQLRLYNNHLQGTLPPEVALLSSLIGFFVSSNSLTGTVPTQLGALNLKVLAVAANRLTGSIPTEIGLLSGLSQLDVHDNMLSASIPSEVGLLVNMAHLDLAENVLQGTIPEVVGDLATFGMLSYLSVSGNAELSGSIPAELCGSNVEVHFNCSENLCGCDCPCD